MGTDVERIIVSMRNIHELWAALLEVGIAIWLLQQQVWIACVVPLVISIGMLVVSLMPKHIAEACYSIRPKHDSRRPSLGYSSDEMD